VRDGDRVRIVIDRNRLEGSVDLVGEGGRRFDPAEGARVLARRPPHPDLAPHPALPADTRLWAALQQASGGTWGGCVFDVERIVELLEAGRRSVMGTRQDTANRAGEPRVEPDENR
jgi:dihydroxyacid dehydratase/phosphogluconate dehydratase